MSVNVMMLAQGTTGTVPHNGTYPCTSEGLVDGLAMPEGDVRVGLETYIVYLVIYGLRRKWDDQASGALETRASREMDPAH
jgi:hypothetical protein